MVLANSTPGDAQRAQSITAILGGAPAPTDHNALRVYLTELAAEGVAALFIRPGSKEPAEVRTVTERNADDEDARRAARDAGQIGWAKARSRGGVYLASADAEVLSAYLNTYLQSRADDVAVNLAVATARSRVVVVDCDTADQVAAFLADAGLDADTPPTVSTPGQRGTDGQWTHSGGGHFWFVVPESVELPAAEMSWTAPGGYVALCGASKYALIPPSTRAEGSYKATGEVRALPEWLAAKITERASTAHLTAAAGDRRVSCADGSAGRISAWGQSVTWASILEPHGWRRHGTDECGCETWTAPGAHASPKSATAHEPGCGSGLYDDNPPLHLWTDHDRAPFDELLADLGRSTLTKLEAVAAADHGNDVGAAMSELDLMDDDPVTLPAPDGADTATAPESDYERKVRDRMLWHAADREARKRLADFDAGEIVLPPVQGLSDLLASEDDSPAPFRIDRVWPAGGAKVMCAAQAKTGKTTLSVNLIRSLVDGDPFLDTFTVNQRAERVVVIDVEMTRSMLTGWMRRQNISNVGAVVDVVNLRGHAGMFDMGNDRLRALWAARLRDLGADFVIFDCLKPVVEAMGLDENRELGKFLYPFSEMLAEAGVEDVLVHHHMGHNNERARGDSSALGWTDGLWKLLREDDQPDTPRYFAAPDIRNVEDPVGEGLLTFDRSTGRLTYAGGNRAATARNDTVETRLNEVLDALADAEVDKDNKNDGGLMSTKIKQAVGGKKDITDKALALATERGLAALRPTTGRSRLYVITAKGRDALNATNDGDPVTLPAPAAQPRRAAPYPGPRAQK